VEEIVGADVVAAAGGEVLALPYAEGYSTTALLERIARACGGGTDG
jgi:D-beta-D-heptose 7-phosphate kinase/D-beta-D-heptose 1-phosphate adenosyltransferase